MTVKTILTVSVLTLTLAGAAYADYDGNSFRNDDAIHCGSTVGQMLSLDAAKNKAMEMGYQVHSIEKDDGCYELEAINKQGQRLELYMNPVTGQITKAEDKS